MYDQCCHDVNLEEVIAIRRLAKDSVEDGYNMAGTNEAVAKYDSMHNARTRSSTRKTGTAVCTYRVYRQSCKSCKGVQGSGAEAQNTVRCEDGVFVEARASSPSQKRLDLEKFACVLKIPVQAL